MRRFHPPGLMRLVISFIACLACASTAAAQYTAQILLPPSDVPSNTQTRAFAINNRGQVFGEALVNRGPVLWTNGVPARLPVPAGYAIANAGSGNLLNDEGVAITTVGRVQGGVLVQGFGDILVWQNGIPSLLPPVPEVLIAGCSEDYGKRPLGINGAGHIFGMSVGLTIPGNPASNTCRRYWIYKNGSFEMLPTQAPPGTQGCALAYVVTESGANLLNSADHVAVQRAGINSPTCPFISGVLAGTSFTPIGQVLAVQINNHDQAIAWSGEANGQTRSYFWNGSGLVDFGVTVGWFSMNNLGQVLFRDVSLGCALRLYSNGTTSNVSLPAGFSYLNSSCDATHLNDGGQIAVAPQGGQIVVLTPSGGGTGDVTAPLLANVSGDMTVTATSGAGATVQWTSPTADDDRDGPVPAVCAPASGSLFPIGSTTVTCTATDSSGNIGAGSFTVTVQSAFPPVAQDASFTTLEDTPISGTLPASNPGGGPLLFSVVTPPLRGTVVITDPSNGAFTYTPELNRFGGASFTFQVSSGTQTSNVATVSITIDPVNDVPLAFDSSVDAIEDTPFTAVFDVGDSDSLVVQFEVVSQPAHGTVTIPNPTAPPLGGSFNYVPYANFNGTDSFTYRVVDGSAISNVATVTLSVAPVNDAPVASSVVETTQESIAKNGVLVATDVDDAVLTFSIATPSTKGTVVVTDATTGAFTYTPNPGAVGYDTFTFRATDVSGESSTATGMAFIVASSPAWSGQTVRVARAFSSSTFPFYGVPSGDGRWVAYCTGRAGEVQELLLDRATGQIEQLSVASDGTPANPSGCGWSMSPDGRYFAFSSPASNLVIGDTNGTSDRSVRDRQAGATSMVSVASDGSQSNGDSWDGVVSADARFVAFVSQASNLVQGDTNGSRDVFVRDLVTGQTSRVSVASDGTQGNADSEDVTMSADGRVVAFQSRASNLVAGDANGSLDVFVHDRATGLTSRISVPSNGTQDGGVWSIGLPSLSADGRFVAVASGDLQVFGTRPGNGTNLAGQCGHGRHAGKRFCPDAECRRAIRRVLLGFAQPGSWRYQFAQRHVRARPPDR